jgi:hypothetical protein
MIVRKNIEGEQTVTIMLPGSFCAWFDGTNLVQGTDDGDPPCKEMRQAYEAGKRIDRKIGYSIAVTANRRVLRMLAEYAEYCLVANRDEPIPSERVAAQLVSRRAHSALALLD